MAGLRTLKVGFSLLLTGRSDCTFRTALSVTLVLGAKVSLSFWRSLAVLFELIGSHGTGGYV